MSNELVEANKCNHNPILSKMSYIASFEEADRRIKRGQKQKQCPVCKLWFFKDEMKGISREMAELADAPMKVGSNGNNKEAWKVWSN